MHFDTFKIIPHYLPVMASVVISWPVVGGGGWRHNFRCEDAGVHSCSVILRFGVLKGVNLLSILVLGMHLHHLTHYPL